MILLTWALWISIVVDGTGAMPPTISPQSANGVFATQAECQAMGDKAEAVVRNLGHADRTAIYECREGTSPTTEAK
jgi:hypothetical protein